MQNSWRIKMWRGTFVRRLAIAWAVGVVAAVSTAPVTPVGATAGGASDAVNVYVTGSPLSNIAMQPLGVSPAFAPTITDYVVRCQPGINDILLSLEAVSAGSITVSGSSGPTLRL